MRLTPNNIDIILEYYYVPNLIKFKTILSKMNFEQYDQHIIFDCYDDDLENNFSVKIFYYPGVLNILIREYEYGDYLNNIDGSYKNLFKDDNYFCQTWYPDYYHELKIYDKLYQSEYFKYIDHVFSLIFKSNRFKEIMYHQYVLKHNLQDKSELEFRTTFFEKLNNK